MAAKQEQKSLDCKTHNKNSAHHHQKTHWCFFNVIGTRFEDHDDQLEYLL
jgi:hypothetical protein